MEMLKLQRSELLQKQILQRLRKLDGKSRLSRLIRRKMMDAVEFYRQFARYCSSSYCSECTIVESCKTKGKDGRDADKIVRTIEQWAKDHPAKTRQSEFLKMFPNAQKSGRVLDICPKNLNIESRLVRQMPPKRIPTMMLSKTQLPNTLFAME